MNKRMRKKRPDKRSQPTPASEILPIPKETITVQLHIANGWTIEFTGDKKNLSLAEFIELMDTYPEYLKTMGVVYANPLQSGSLMPPAAYLQILVQHLAVAYKVDAVALKTGLLRLAAKEDMRLVLKWADKNGEYQKAWLEAIAKPL